MHVRTTNGKYLIAALLYALASCGLFFYTSGGWTALLYLFGGGLFTSIICIVLIVCAVSRRKYAKTVRLYVPIFLVLFAIQAFLLLFNFGDCGDSSGMYQFIQRVMHGGSFEFGLCGEQAVGLLMSESAMGSFLQVFQLLILAFVILEPIALIYPLVTEPKEDARR